MPGQIKLITHNTVSSNPAPYRRYRTCDRKKVYDSMDQGWGAVRHIQKNGKDLYPDFELRPYECEFCHQVHVGHSNMPKSSEKRTKII